MIKGSNDNFYIMKSQQAIFQKSKRVHIRQPKKYSTQPSNAEGIFYGTFYKHPYPSNSEKQQFQQKKFQNEEENNQFRMKSSKDNIYNKIKRLNKQTGQVDQLKSHRSKTSEQTQRDNFQTLRIQYKKISDLYQDKELEEEAKKFIARLKLDKQKFKGKLHLRKMQEIKRKREQHRKEVQQIEDKKVREKRQRREKARQNLKELKIKVENRHKKSMKIQSRSRTLGTQSPPPIYSQSSLKQKITLSPTKSQRNKIGNQYMYKFGKVKNKCRSFSVASERKEFQSLMKEEQIEIEELRKQIKAIKSTISSY